MPKLSKMGGSGQNPLMLPPVLDILFSYLAFRDLKSSRLVCSTWDGIAFPLIGHEELKLNHSYITYKDLLALRKKSQAKLDLFQGILRKFRFTWEQISGIDNFNFMGPFFPSELFISGKDVADPSASLILLISPIVVTLTHLHLDIKWGGMSSFNLGCLVGLGLRLDDLHLDIRQNGNPALLWGMFELLGSQAPTLEELFIRVVCNFVNTPRDVNEASRIINEFPRFPFPKAASHTPSKHLEISTKCRLSIKYTSG